MTVAKRYRPIIIGAIAILALAFLLALTRTSSGHADGHTTNGPLLPWELPNGEIDYSKLPNAVPKLDCNGNVIGLYREPFGDTSRYIPKDLTGHPCVEIRTEAQAHPPPND